MDFYKQGSMYALEQLKLSFVSPAPPSMQQNNASKPIPATKSQNFSMPNPAPAGPSVNPAPGSGPFPTNQTGKGSIPSAPSAQAGVTGTNTPSAAPQGATASAMSSSTGAMGGARS